jgi:hypothetical protein
MATRRAFTMMTGLLFLGASVASAQAPAGEMMGKHTMDGEVTKVDSKKGWVDVKTSEGSMKLHFPPAALGECQEGGFGERRAGAEGQRPGAEEGVEDDQVTLTRVGKTFSGLAGSRRASVR